MYVAYKQLDIVLQPTLASYCSCCWVITILIPGILFYNDAYQNNLVRRCARSCVSVVYVRMYITT